MSSSFTIGFQIPLGAGPGSHAITICTGNPCLGGDFEERASAAFQVTGAPAAGNFDVQVQAIEVTQGIRGDIPRRTPPGGESRLPPDGAIHVANRRTVVRVYPWIQVTGGSPFRRLTARLYGIRDGEILPGSPLTPLNPLVAASSIETLDDQRADPARTWNFDIPAFWIDLRPGEESFQVAFIAEANPEGLTPECAGCSFNNDALLPVVEFRRMVRAPYIPFAGLGRAVTSPIVVIPYLVTHSCTDDTGLQAAFPTLSDLQAALSDCRRLLPIPDGARGMLVFPPIGESWDSGTCSRAGKQNDQRRFTRRMLRRHFPGGSRRGDPVGVFRVFFVGGDRFASGGYAWCRSSLVVGNKSKFAIAHEITHAIGLDHAGRGHCEKYFGGCISDYPDPHGQVEANAYGFDTWSFNSIPPGPYSFPPAGWDLTDDCQQPPGFERTHDYMSGGAGPKWTSLYTWEKTGYRLGGTEIRGEAGAGGNQPNGEYLLLSGSIGDGDEVELDPLFLSFAPAEAPQPNGEYWVEFSDIQGNVLSIQMIEVGEPSDATEQLRIFNEPVLVPPGWQELAVVRNQVALGKFLRSRNPPGVSLTQPADGSQWPAEGELTVAWEASDADGDPLTYLVEVSPDGQGWVTLAADVKTTSVQLDLDAVPAGGEIWLLRVEASDGLLVGVSKERQVLIPPRPPQPYILHPIDGDVFPAGSSLPVEGLAGDWQEGGVDPGDLEWSLDGSFLGNGTTLLIGSLAPGKHSLVLKAVNSLGLEGFLEARFEVEGSAGLQMPGDANQDGEVDISDVIALISYLFLGSPAQLPCGSGGATDPANVTLLDFNGGGEIDLSDGIAALTWLFLGGSGHFLGPVCTPIEGCPDRCQ